MEKKIKNKGFLNIMLYCSGQRFLEACFILIAAACLIAGIICLNSDATYARSVSYVNGVKVSEGPQVPVSSAAPVCFGFAIIFGPVVVIFTELVCKYLIFGGLKDYPIALNAMPKEELMNAATARDSINENYEVIVDGSWIAVSFNWQKCTELSLIGVKRRCSVYIKYFRVYNNHTFRDVDKEGQSVVDFSLGKIDAFKNVHYGHISHKVIQYDLSYDENTGHAGANKYTLDTREMTNSMHKWFADRGYKYVR